MIYKSVSRRSQGLARRSATLHLEVIQSLESLLKLPPRTRSLLLIVALPIWLRPDLVFSEK